MNAVLARCEAVNVGYIQPMQPSEVKAIAKSIAKWTMLHFTPQRFSASQAKKGRKGGQKSVGGGRPLGTIKVESEAQQKPWETLGISRATYFRHKKSELL